MRQAYFTRTHSFSYLSLVLSHYYTHLLDETGVKSNCPGAFGVVLTLGGSPSGNCANINTASARLNKRHLYQHGKLEQSISTLQ
jgi:hypothetical protein